MTWFRGAQSGVAVSFSVLRAPPWSPETSGSRNLHFPFAAG